MDLVDDPLPEGLFDCILCAGVLVYLPMDVQQSVCQKIIASLPCGGDLLLEHGHKRSPGELAGPEVHSLYRRNPELSEIYNHEEEEYAITIFCKANP
jgi:chemotaxis methyl-accepting protein methylase